MTYFAERNPQYTEHMADEITTEAVLEYLDSQAVDRGVVLSEYAPLTSGVVSNEFTVSFCAETDRLIPFASVSLHEGAEPAVQAEHAVRTLGCRGIKLLPTYVHFYPDDKRLQPVYEVASALEVPVMFHTGTSLFKGSRIRYGHPLLLDDVAEDFPRMTIVLCHGGRPFWYAEAEWMVRRHENCFIDISGIPPRKIPVVFPHLESLRDRFLFGSDWPGVPSIAEQVRKIEDLPLHSETLEALLWKNAARVLRIDAHGDERDHE